MPRVTGPFDVKITPQAPDGTYENEALGRLTLDKQFHGDLDAASRGQMLTGNGNVKGSAGYVAVERVSGTLAGKRGSFILMHTGTMVRGGDFNLSVIVVPDSGTDELAGLSGKMAIIFEGKNHFYDFEYTIATPAAS